MAKIRKAKGMAIFTLIWFGQLVSLIGSGLTGFALGVWVYQSTGSVTQFAFISLSTTLPLIAISPLAGALVDRLDRRWVMILSDSGAGLSTLALTLLLITGRLEVWHIYLVSAVSSALSAFQWPAYTAATTLLVPKRHLDRASGMIQLGKAVSRLASPILGGLLLVTIQLRGIILIDFATFLFALVTLLCIRFPEVETTFEKKSGKTSLLKEIASGWTYITTRPGLLGLVLFFVVVSFMGGVVEVLATPLVLSFASAATLGSILSFSGSGMLIGSLLMSTYGGPSNRIDTLFTFMALGGLCLMAAGLRPSTFLFTLSAFLFFLGLPLINGSSQVIFQRKVLPSMQGKVFSLQDALAGVSLLIAYGVAGPLADRVFEPLMATDGLLSSSIGEIIGVGPGRGIGLLFIIMGALTILVTVVAYQYSPLRLVERQLPDAVADEAIVGTES